MSRILVIEDDAISRQLASDALTAAGYVVTSVGSGEAALESVAEVQPDLVVMDIKLPGIDGLEVARRLKSGPTTTGIPLLAVTAEAMEADRERILAAGCDAYMAKPIRFTTLLTMVSDLLEARAELGR